MAALSRRSTILFLVAIAAVSAFVLVELPRRRAEERVRAERSRFAAFDATAVDAITIARDTGILRLEIVGSHWEVAAPVRDVAELSAVAVLLSSLKTATVIRDLGPADDPVRYGLSPPAVSVALTAGADTLASIDLGIHTVDRSAVYARRSGDDHVVLVSTDLYRAATTALEDFRDHDVLSFDLSVVTGYALRSRRTGTMVWERGPRDRWFAVSAGDTVRGDSLAVAAVLREVRGMRVRSFVADADTAGAFTDPLVSLRVRKRGAPAVAVHFADRPGGVMWARVDGAGRVVEVDGDIDALAARSVATLRDRRLLQFDPRRAVRLTVSAPDTAGVLVRAGDRWALPNPAMGGIDPALAADFVRALRALQFDRALPPGAAAARGGDIFSLVVQARGDTILDELRAAPRPGDGTWVVTSRSTGFPSEIEASKLEAIVARLKMLRRAATAP